MVNPVEPSSEVARPSRRTFIRGGPALGLGLAAGAMVGCATDQNPTAQAGPSEPGGDGRLFNGLSAKP